MIVKSVMENLKKLIFIHSNVEDCNYYFSNLEPSVGQDIVGIESLRRENFKQIIKQLLKYKANPKF